MSNSKKRVFKDTRPETEEKLGKIGFSRALMERSASVMCRQPSCRKVVQEQYTRQGYCLSCVEVAKSIKAKRMEKVAAQRLENAFYDHNDFGVF